MSAMCSSLGMLACAASVGRAAVGGPAGCNSRVGSLTSILIGFFWGEKMHSIVSSHYLYLKTSRGICFTVNVDIFACINFRRLMKMGNFACIKFAFLVQMTL